MKNILLFGVGSLFAFGIFMCVIAGFKVTQVLTDSERVQIHDADHLSKMLSVLTLGWLISISAALTFVAVAKFLPDPIATRKMLRPT